MVVFVEYVTYGTIADQTQTRPSAVKRKEKQNSETCCIYGSCKRLPILSCTNGTTCLFSFEVFVRIWVWRFPYTFWCKGRYNSRWLPFSVSISKSPFQVLSGALFYTWRSCSQYCHVHSHANSQGESLQRLMTARSSMLLVRLARLGANGFPSGRIQRHARCHHCACNLGSLPVVCTLHISRRGLTRSWPRREAGQRHDRQPVAMCCCGCIKLDLIQRVPPPRGSRKAMSSGLGMEF